MSPWRSTIGKLWGQKEEGATIVEYALLLALIALACVAAISLLGTQISSFFSSTASSI